MTDKGKYFTTCLCYEDSAFILNGIALQARESVRHKATAVLQHHRQLLWNYYC